MDEDNDHECGAIFDFGEEEEIAARPLYLVELLRIPVDLVGRVTLGVSSTCAQLSDLLVAAGKHAEEQRLLRQEAVNAMEAMNLLAPSRREL